MRRKLGFFIRFVTAASMAVLGGAAFAKDSPSVPGAGAKSGSSFSCDAPDCTDVYPQVGLALGCQGPNDYPHGYGVKYCRRFSDLLNDPKISANMKCWVCGTKKCLMIKAKEATAKLALKVGGAKCAAQATAWVTDPNPTTSKALQDCIYAGMSLAQRELARVSVCAELQTMAFDHHPDCYRFSGTYGGCHLACLTEAELAYIATVVDVKDLVTLGSLKQCFETGVGLISDYEDPSTLPGPEPRR